MAGFWSVGRQQKCCSRRRLSGCTVPRPMSRHIPCMPECHWSCSCDAIRLFIIKGGRSPFARLVFAKNSSNGSNADVPIDSILGIPGLVVQEVKRAKDIHVWAGPRKRPACVHCASNRVRVKATYQRTLKHTRQGNKLVMLHLRVPKYHCTECNRYFRHRFAGILPRLRSTETYRLEVFEA